MSNEDLDLYSVLNVPRDASKSEIKKAYHKAALHSHPDKVAPEQRAEAEQKFKAVSQAYEILHDDQKRSLYDQHGMAAFEKGANGFGAEGADMNDILASMFGGMGGNPFGGMKPGQKRPKGRSELQGYEVTLEELYKGKSTKFASTKNVICPLCHGSGGKDGAKPKECDTCKGRGMTTRLRQVGPGMVTQETVTCSVCHGQGKFYAEKDKCKKCKGERVIQEKKMLELYIPPGSKQGDRIVLAGEADQSPDDLEPGDLVFELVEQPDPVFTRAGADLQAEINITLVEALTGLNRVVLKHLDGRGLSINVQQPNGKVLRPGEVLKVAGEGMPHKKRPDTHGDLYLVVNVQFPEDGWIDSDEAIAKIRDVLPKPAVDGPKDKDKDTIMDGVDADGNKDKDEVVDEVDFEVMKDLDDFGIGGGSTRRGAQWEDEDDDQDGGPQTAQCAQQ